MIVKPIVFPRGLPSHFHQGLPGMPGSSGSDSSTVTRASQKQFRCVRTREKPFIHESITAHSGLFRIHPSSSFSSAPNTAASVAAVRRASLGPAPLNLISLQNNDSDNNPEGGSSQQRRRQRLMMNQPLPSLPVRKRGPQRKQSGGEAGTREWQ